MADKKDDLPSGADGFRLKKRPNSANHSPKKNKKSIGIVRCYLPLDADGFRLKNVRIRPTFRRKTKKKALEL